MALKKEELRQFSGTETWRSWSPLFPKMLLTDGAKYVADHGGESGAYWLMDAIASYQPQLQKDPQLEAAQFWKLQVRPDRTATLLCRADSNVEPAVKQEIEFTDFDLPEIELYCMPVGDGKHHTILLPSEY